MVPDMEPVSSSDSNTVPVASTVTEKYRALIQARGRRLSGPEFEEYQAELRAERKGNAVATA